MAPQNSNKVAIVTGGASGIGLDLVKNLVSKSWNVVIADVNKEGGEKLVKELGPLTRFHQTDVSSWDDQAALFKYTHSEFGRFDFLAANAGIDDKKSLYTETEDEKDAPAKPFLKALDINLTGVIYGVKLAVWYMRRNPGTKGGNIVMTASTAGLYPMQTNPIYAATKAALINFTRSVAPMYGKEGIRVNAICPALVPTNLAPAGLLDLFPQEHITPLSTITSAFIKLVENEEYNGQIVECSQDNHFFRQHVEFPSPSSKWVQEDSGPYWAKAYDQYFEKIKPDSK